MAEGKTCPRSGTSPEGQESASPARYRPRERLERRLQVGRTRAVGPLSVSQTLGESRSGSGTHHCETGPGPERYPVGGVLRVDRTPVSSLRGSGLYGTSGVSLRSSTTHHSCLGNASYDGGGAAGIVVGKGPSHHERDGGRVPPPDAPRPETDPDGRCMRHRVHVTGGRRPTLPPWAARDSRREVTSSSRTKTSLPSRGPTVTEDVRSGEVLRS